ncbi:MAG: hypothetical protein IJB30_07295 [Clostridia bacterium]|nr:hypothetical protein [Clostridia bacterium]
MKGNKLFKRVFAVTAAVMLALLPAAAFAAVEASAAADKTAVQAGDIVEVTITVAGKELAAAEGTYSYDPALLTYTESEGGASDGFISMVSAQKDGSDSLTARIKFTAAGAGNAEVTFDITKVLDYDGDEAGTAKGSVAITVQAAPASTEPTPAPINYAAEGVAAVNLTSDQPMYIWRTLENVTVPSKYTETTLDYHGETVAAAIVEDSDAPTLLYLSNAAGDVGGYYIYDADKDTLYPYQTVNSVSKSYILLQPDGSVALPAGFSETSITIDEKPVTAWVSQDAQGDIYLLYGRNPDGEVGYYLYNPQDESLQRYAVMPARPTQPVLPEAEETAPVEEPPAEESVTGEGITLPRPVFYGVCGLVAALVITIIAMAVSSAREKARRKRRAEQRRAERKRMLAEETEEKA